MALESYAPASSHHSAAVNPACRWDLLGHVIILNRRHLQRLMNEYVVYYSRGTHPSRAGKGNACRS